MLPLTPARPRPLFLNSETGRPALERRGGNRRRDTPRGDDLRQAKARHRRHDAGRGGQLFPFFLAGGGGWGEAEHKTKALPAQHDCQRQQRLAAARQDDRPHGEFFGRFPVARSGACRLVMRRATAMRWCVGGSQRRGGQAVGVWGSSCAQPGCAGRTNRSDLVLFALRIALGLRVSRSM